MGRFQLNLHHILSFYCLAKEQSFSGAAEQLGITQPTVTQHVRGLETQFGIKLINLRKQRVHLTKAGENLIAYAEELFNQAVLTENFLKNYRSNNLSIGIAGGLILSFAGLIDHFKEIHPSIKISLREAPSKVLVEELLSGQHDICIAGTLSLYSDQLKCYRINWDKPMVFVASPDYPIDGSVPAKWAELASHPLIIPSEGSDGRAITLYEFKKRGLKPNIGTEVSNIEIAKELAKQNKGIALLFEPNIRRQVEKDELRIIRVEDGEIRMGAFYVMTHREVKLSLPAKSFLALIKDRFNKDFHVLLDDYKPEVWKQ